MSLCCKIVNHIVRKLLTKNFGIKKIKGNTLTLKKIFFFKFRN